MKRLTYRDEEGTPHWSQELMEDDTGWAGELIRSTVADIEDAIGDCSIERLRELVEADKAGRCVVLPCKYGERVYCVYHKREEHFGCANCLAGYGMGVVCDYYNAETYTCTNNPEKYKNYEIISKHFEASMIPNSGKTVFKNRKDAESACEALEKKLERPYES